jgi:hypothetical protein
MTHPERHSDDALQREIEALLLVDHSPEFRARVRTSLVAVPAPAPWRFGWLLLPAGVALCAAMLALLWPGREPVPPEAPVTVRAADGPAPLESPAIPVPAPAAIEPEHVSVSVRAAPPRSGPPPFPEVVISAEETRALRLLLTSVPRGRMPEMPETEPARADQLLTLDDVKVATLVIEPLALMAQLEGERR